MAKEEATATGNTREEINAIILNYLKKMGFRQTEHFFKEEAHTANLETMAFELRNDQDASISNYLLFGGRNLLNNGNISGSLYEQTYEGLRKWIHGSLDSIREELLSILFPIYVHCFLDLVAKGLAGDAAKFFELFKDDHVARYAEELDRLTSITDPSQLRENALAANFRTNKYNVVMSAYSFQLLMAYLQESTGANVGLGSILILKIINQFVNIRVLVSKTNVLGSNSSAAVNVLGTGITGVSIGGSIGVNREPMLWGVNPISTDIELAIQQSLQKRLQKDHSGKSATDTLQSTIAQLKRTFGPSLQKAPDADRISHPEFDSSEFTFELERLRDLGRRAILSSTTKPSICCYTVHNSYDGITAMDFSSDFTKLATGTRHSYIDIWSLTREPLKSIRPSTELAAMDLTNVHNLEPLREQPGQMTKRLIGHSGPVYGLSFLSTGGSEFLLSGSQDRSIRLWNLDLYTSVAAYRSHSLPVWDIDVAPICIGPYFVSASADRTARLWSLERIQPLRVFAGHLSDVDVVKFHPNGNYVATGSSDKTCRIWDLLSGKCVRLLTGHERTPSTIAFSPDGRVLASGDRQGVVRLWDLAEGRLIRTLTRSKKPSLATPNSIYSLSFCQDGKILASGGADSAVTLWDVTKATNVATKTDEECYIASYPTKSTPLTKVSFTRRNVLVVGGSFSPEDTL